MSDAYYINSGTWHVCPVCGKRFFTTSPGEYVYKRPTKTESGATMAYFCKWPHLRQWERELENGNSR